MGHVYDFAVFPEKTSKEKMFKSSQEFAFFNVDREENPSGSYFNQWIQHSEVLDSESEAESFLNRQGIYVDGCVRFREPAKPSAKMINLEERIKTTRQKKHKFDKVHNVTSRKSAFIGCNNCGSKIARNYLRGDYCPVCNKDLRAEYIVKKLKEYDEKIEFLKEEYKKEKKKQAKKRSVVKWLVKTEVHC